MLASTSLPPGREPAVFQFRDFRRFMSARFLVASASEMQSVAVGWQIYALTGRPLDLGLVGLAQFAPTIALFLVGGHTADRYPRERVLQTCFAAFSLCSAALLALTVRHNPVVSPMYGVLLCNGAIRAFHGPAGQAFLPLIVPPRVFPSAVAWGSSIFQAAVVLGPLAGGLVYALANGPAPVYAASGCAYLAALALLSTVRTHRDRATRVEASWNGMLDGFRYVWSNKVILGAISLDLFAVLLGGAVALLPVYAREILNAGPTALGVLRSAPGIGALLTAAAVARWPLRRRAGAVMLWCVFGFGVFTFVFGVSRSLALSVVSLAMAGACDMVSVIIRHTVVQLSAPDRMRGRISAVNTIFIGASNEVGQFESGLTAHWFGTIPAVLFGAIGTVTVVAVWSRLFPGLRKVDQLTG